MLHFRRIDPTESILSLKYITFVGAGGKTSLMEYLAARLVKRGKTVAVTTTTKIWVREPYVLMNGNHEAPEYGKPLMRFGKAVENGKLTGVDPDDIEHLGSIYDVVLIEGDGAKGRPLKYPASHEPVIAPLTERTFVVGGLDALWGRVNERVFRWELFTDAIGVPGDRSISPAVFLGFFSPHVMLKSVDERKCTIVLNKYDALSNKHNATAVAGALVREKGLNVIISSVLFHCFYEAAWV